MEIWLPAIEGVVIIALLAVLLLMQRKNNSGEALRRASQDMVRELKAELDAQFHRTRTENAEQGSIARREMQESFFYFRKQSEEQWVRQNEAQDINWRSADQRINNLLRDSE